MASSPRELIGFGVDHRSDAINIDIGAQVVVRCTPAHIRQIRAGFAVTGLPPLVHSRCTF
jgi:hypothetical protein